MSWQFHNDRYLEVNANLTAALNGGVDWAIGYWLKSPTGVNPRFAIVDTTVEPDQFARMLDAGTGEQQAFVVSGSGNNGFTTGHGATPDNTWCVLLHEYINASTTLRSSLNNGSAGSNSGIGLAFTLTSAMKVHIGADFEGTPGNGDYLVDHFFIAKRNLTSDERTSLYGGGTAGANPADLLGADCIFYLYDDYTNTHVGGYSMTQVGAGSAITWNAGDPSPGAAPTGGGGGGITLAHVERGRTIGRGIGRGIR